MADPRLSEIQVETRRTTDILRWGTERLRRFLAEQDDLEKKFKENNQENSPLPEHLNQLRKKVEQEQADLKDHLDKARKLADQMSDVLNQYRSKPTESNWPMEFGLEHWNQARASVTEHKQMLENARGQLGQAINEAAKLLGERPDAEKSIWSQNEGLLDMIERLVLPITKIARGNFLGFKVGIGGISIGIPIPAGLYKRIGLTLDVDEVGNGSNGSGYDSTLPKQVKLPFFPS